MLLLLQSFPVEVEEVTNLVHYASLFHVFSFSFFTSLDLPLPFGQQHVFRQRWWWWWPGVPGTGDDARLRLLLLLQLLRREGHLEDVGRPGAIPHHAGLPQQR